MTTNADGLPPALAAADESRPAAFSGLAARILKGGSWAIVGNLTSQALRFGSNLVLTRLLFPEAFGLMAIAQAILMAARLFSDVGLMQGVVRSARGHEQRYLDTVWTLDILKGTLIVLVMSALGWPMAKAYGQPSLVALLPAMGIAALISSFASTKIALLNRQLEVGRLTAIELSSQVCGIVTMIVWARISPTPWALVAGNWVSAFVMMACSHLVLPGRRNRFAMDRSVVREVMSFGTWVMVSSSVTFLVGEGSNLLNAALVGAKTVGFLGISTALVMVTWNLIQTVVGRVLFPAYSEIWRQRPQDLPRAVERSRRLQMLGVAAVATVLAVAGDKLIDLIYDHRYHAVGALIQIQAVGTVFKIIISSYAGVPWAMGRPGLNTFMLSIEATILFTLLWVGHTLGGTLGLVAGGALMGVFMYPVNALVYRRYGLFQPRTDVWAFLFGGVLAAWVWHFGLWHSVTI
ncbi:MAG: oligosaccharide flippase family protein, partial [Betaproteobacteria bacterium]